MYGQAWRSFGAARHDFRAFVVAGGRRLKRRKGGPPHRGGRGEPIMCGPSLSIFRAACARLVNAKM